MGIIVGFIYENELAEMAVVYLPVGNYKGFIPVEMAKVID